MSDYVQVDVKKNPNYYKQNNLKDILIYLLKTWMYTVS